VLPQHLPRRSPASHWLLLASPRRLLSARAAPRRRSPSLQDDQYHLLLPSDPTRHSFALPPPSRPCAVSHPHSPRRTAAARASLCRHVRRRRDSSCFRVTTSPSRPQAHPGTPSTLALAFAYTHFTQFLLLRSPPFSRPSPPSLAIIDSRPHHPRTLIQCNQSSAVTRWCSLAPPISFSRILAPLPAAPMSSKLRRRLASRRTAGIRPLHPDQGHQKHHTNRQKLFDYFPATLRHPSLRNAAPPSPPLRTRPAPPSITTFCSVSDQIR
jgi:hypothetical protein